MSQKFPSSWLQTKNFQHKNIDRLFTAEEPVAAVKDCHECCCDEPLQFTEDIGEYKASDLTEAAKAVFGELDPRRATPDGSITPKVQSNESKAIASEIFNRHQQINDTRSANQALKPQLSPLLEALKSKREELKKRSTGVGAKELEELTLKIKNFNQSISSLEDQIGELSKAQRSAEHFIPGDRDKAPLTLTDIVSASTVRKGIRSPQFVGYYKEKDNHEVADIKDLVGEPCERQCQRWKAAKEAVKKIAEQIRDSKDPNGVLDSIAKDLNSPGGKRFYYNRSSNSGARKMNDGDVRIGGNDFSNESPTAKKK